MRIARRALALCGALLCGCSHSTSPVAKSSTPVTDSATTSPKATPLILEKNEGERRVLRGWAENPNPGETYILKVDPKNGGSAHMVFLTAELKPGAKIPTHRHPRADEILFFQNGIASVTLGNTVKDVHAGATVFIPADTWIGVSNTGKKPITLVGIFSAPGFEEFLRAETVPEAEKNVPISDAEDEAALKMHTHDVIYKQP